MARRLTDLPDTFRVLHDRRIRGAQTNIDHIVIGPTGIWVIDAKRYVGKRPALREGGGIIRPRVETWPLIGGSFSVGGVHVLWPRLLVQRVTDAPLEPIDVDLIHNQLARAFPSA